MVTLVETWNPDDLILNCYRLAKYYHVNPEVFMEMPIFSRLSMHVYYTAKLIEAQRKASRRDDDD